MGAWVSFTNHIDIAKNSFENGALKFIGYNDITSEMMDEFVRNQQIKWVQIGSELPKEAYQVIDSMLEQRPDWYFRIWGLSNPDRFDFSVLKQMKHLKKLRLDFSVSNISNMIDFSILSELEQLKSIHLNLFDLRDYGFINHLPKDMEEITIYADTTGGAIKFDCKWLLQYQNLKYLYLGKKAKKNLKSICELRMLKKLTLRGIKVKSYSFLEAMNLESLALLWCGNNDLHELAKLDTLKSLELWRIMKLENIDFISSLVNLETLKLQDLKHITLLPDLSRLHNLRQICVDNVPIDLDATDDAVKKLIL